VTGAEPQTEDDDRTLVAPTADGLDSLVAVGRALQEAGIGVDDLSLRQPTLDEVFLTLTGARADDRAEQESA
jgi:ABC-2 type transport system ATP-binding protein